MRPKKALLMKKAFIKKLFLYYKGLKNPKCGPCMRYDGNGAYDQWSCLDICTAGGFCSSTWWPTYHLCCCDCGGFLCT